MQKLASVEKGLSSGRSLNLALYIIGGDEHMPRFPSLVATALSKGGAHLGSVSQASFMYRDDNNNNTDELKEHI